VNVWEFLSSHKTCFCFLWYIYKTEILTILLMSISVLDYELRDLEIPTITVVGKLVKAGIPVLVYRYVHASCLTNCMYLK